jgi:hypothetical protein
MGLRCGGLVTFLAGIVWLTSAAAIPSQAKPAKVDFSRDILPILSDKCFKCHGPDSGSRMADMRLDLSTGAFANRGGRFPIVPGKPSDSLVVRRINDSNSPMPPVFSGKHLDRAEKELIEKWIREGAQYGKLWSFAPLPSKVLVPQSSSPWPKNDIDRFILQRLTKEGLKPSPPAPKLRWLRRVTLDLTGLPPTESEIADFQSDAKADAYERVVDRLLASPHFGERAAVDWLDAARYSDSYGYQSDLLMPSWPYRDWVVKAFNQNMPYNEFLIEQLAGDLLPHPTRDQRLATAFNRLHRQSNEGGSIADEFKNEYAVDRVDTFGTAVLGLTVGCARCHDHKFDPITQREYYQFYAYFNSINEYGLLLSTEIVPTPSLLLPTPDQESKLVQLQKRSDDALAHLRQAIDQADGRFRTWLDSNPGLDYKVNVGARFPLDSYTDKFPSSIGNAFGAKLGNVELVAGHSSRGDDKAILLDGDNGLSLRGLPAKDRWEPFTWSFWISDPGQKSPVVLLHRTGGTDVGFCGFDLMLEDGYLTARVMRHWPGNAVGIRTKERIPPNSWQHIAWQWDGSGRADGLRIFTNGKLAKAEVLQDKLWKKINAYGDLAASGGDWTFGQRFRDAGFKGGKVDDIAFANQVLSGAEIANLYDGKAVEGSALREYYATSVDPTVLEAFKRMDAAQKDLAEFEEGIYEVEVMEDTPKPIPAYVLARGQYDAPKTDASKVVRGVPKALPPLQAPGTNNRLALAKWATQPSNPLTSRVAANRLWQMIFGVGLVETSENFGVQGGRPTHPELLDYLARKFVDSGWNVKALVKSMVLSATYRQDSARTKGVKDKDPENRLYSRGPNRRLGAEMVRDTVLAASGLLYDKLGGPPVNPYQPAGIWQENNTMSPAFVQSKGQDLYRRSLYSTWKRTTPVPNILLFDATSREACMVRRPTTNTPLQALVLLNDVQYVEASRVLAEVVLKAKKTDAERIGMAFVRLAGREPDAKELAILLKTAVEQSATFNADAESAKKLISVGESKADSKIDPVTLASMTVVVQTILNSDAVIWKR